MVLFTKGKSMEVDSWSKFNVTLVDFIFEN